MTPATLGWMAGILDLKGMVIRKQNKQRRTIQIVIAVETKELSVIEELCKLTGTNAEMHEQREVKFWMRKGCEEHCPDRHVHVAPYEHNPIPKVGRWTITGAGAAVILHNLAPFLRSAKFPIELLSEIFENTPLVGQGSGMVAKSIRRLKYLGWELPEQFEDVEI